MKDSQTTQSRLFANPRQPDAGGDSAPFRHHLVFNFGQASRKFVYNGVGLFEACLAGTLWAILISVSEIPSIPSARKRRRHKAAVCSADSSSLSMHRRIPGIFRFFSIAVILETLNGGCHL